LRTPFGDGTIRLERFRRASFRLLSSAAGASSANLEAHARNGLRVDGKRFMGHPEVRDRGIPMLFGSARVSRQLSEGMR
jgi:hypothetical protein